MILVDANLLLYAYDTDSPFHAAAREWLGRVIETEPLIGLPWTTVLAFLRITTHPGLASPQSLDWATAIIEDWLKLPNVQLLHPGDHHWGIVKKVAREGQARGPLLTDAALAALAIEYGATLCTADRGFSRFPGLRLMNPIANNK